MESTVEAFAARIQDATARGAKCCIRGGGSKDFYGGPLTGELLDTRGLRGIVAYEPSELYVTVRAGTSLAELQASLAAQGQHLPFEPPHFNLGATAGHGSAASGARRAAAGDSLDSGAAAQGEASCGGMLACALAGPARVSAGGVRDHVLGLSMLNGRGEHLVFGGQVMKNVAGYDLSRVLAGSMGTLGLILDLSLKVLPLPQAQASLRFEAGQVEALAMLARWNALALPLNASCWVEQEGRPLLTLRLRGAEAAVRSACASMGGEALVPDAAERFWAACRDQRLPFFSWADVQAQDAAQAGGDGESGPCEPEGAGMAALWRLSVAPTSPALSLPQAQLIEWHGGLRWLWAPLGEAAAIRAAAERAGGHASLFRTRNAAARAGGVFHPLGPATWRIQQELKRQFDPAGIFNPGRLYPGL